MLEESLRSQGKEPVSEICRWNEELIKLGKMEIIPSALDQTSNYRPTSAKPLVFHLLGSIDYPPSMVLTEQDYLAFLNNTNKIELERDTLPVYLRRELTRSALLFIGYSVDDINFRSLFQVAL